VQRHGREADGRSAPPPPTHSDLRLQKVYKVSSEAELGTLVDKFVYARELSHGSDTYPQRRAFIYNMLCKLALLLHGHTASAVGLQQVRSRVPHCIMRHGSHLQAAGLGRRTAGPLPRFSYTSHGAASTLGRARMRERHRVGKQRTQPGWAHTPLRWYLGWPGGSCPHPAGNPHPCGATSCREVY
jgi:hypothetical protein